MEDVVLKKAYVEKETKYVKTHHRRYLVLKGHFLYSYKDSDMNDNPTEINLCEYNQYCVVNDEDEDIGYVKAMKKKCEMNCYACRFKDSNFMTQRKQLWASLRQYGANYHTGLIMDYLHKTLLKFKISSKKKKSVIFVANSYLDLCEWMTLIKVVAYKSFQFAAYVKITTPSSMFGNAKTFNFTVDVKNNKIVKCAQSTEFNHVLNKAIQIYGTACIVQCDLKLTLEMGYLENKPVWNLHNKGLIMQLMQKPSTQKLNVQSKNDDYADSHSKRKKSAYNEFAKHKEQLYSLQNTTDTNKQKSENTVLVTVNVINNKEMNCKLMVPNNGRRWPFSCFDNYDVMTKMNDLYRPTRFKVHALNQANTIDLEVDSFTHKVGSTNITCKHMLNHMDENKSNVLNCPIYRGMKIDYQFSEDNLLHLNQFNHFKNEYDEKPECKWYQKCRAFVRLEENGYRLDDRCHLKMYAHPPRNRQIPLDDNVHLFIMNKQNQQNHPLYTPSFKANYKDGYLKQLIDEVARNGFEKDLYLPQDDEKGNDYSLIHVVDDKMYAPRHKNMSCPLSRAEMLAIILYTGCDCNYDLCGSQRRGDYKKWKYFDLCLFNAINKLKQLETGKFKIYTGLNNVKLNKKSIQNGYFVTYVSTSWKIEVSKKFMGETGMIMQIDESFRENMCCCDVSWISKFEHECEILIARSVGKQNNFHCKILDEVDGVQVVSLFAR
eukprot:58177_1